MPNWRFPSLLELSGSNFPPLLTYANHIMIINSKKSLHDILLEELELSNMWDPRNFSLHCKISVVCAHCSEIGILVQPLFLVFKNCKLRRSFSFLCGILTVKMLLN